MIVSAKQYREQLLETPTYIAFSECNRSFGRAVRDGLWSPSMPIDAFIECFRKLHDLGLFDQLNDDARYIVTEAEYHRADEPLSPSHFSRRIYFHPHILGNGVVAGYNSCIHLSVCAIDIETNILRKEFYIRKNFQGPNAPAGALKYLKIIGEEVDSLRFSKSLETTAAITKICDEFCAEYSPLPKAPFSRKRP